MSSNDDLPIEPPTYQGDATTLSQAAISDNALLSIAKIIRAFAEIEDCLDLFICTLAETSESKLVILLGRTPYSKKLEIARSLASLRDDKALEVYRVSFTQKLAMLKKNRDIIAHGPYLGKTPQESYAFLSSDTEEPIGSAVTKTVFAVNEEQLRIWANALIDYIPKLEARLKIEALRRKYRAPDLQPHPKAQRQRSSKRTR